MENITWENSREGGAMTTDGQHLRRHAATAALMLVAALAITGCSGATEAGSSSALAAETPLVEIRDDDAKVKEAETTAPNLVNEEVAPSSPSAAQTALDTAVTAIEAQGTTVGYIVIDIATGETLERNADALFYSASSIKGPYCVSLLRTLGGQARGAYSEPIRACLADSSNDDYDALRQAYVGQRFFPDFAREAGCSSDVSDRGGWWYTFYSVRDLAKLWALADRWLAEGGEDAAWVGQILGDTLYSQVDESAGGDAVTTWSKAGWFWETGDGCAPVTIDGGAVHTAAGDYAIAVAVDRGSDFDAIKSVMEPLVTVWDERSAAAAD